MHLLFIIREIDNEPQGILQISSVVRQGGHRTSLVVATEEDPLKAVARLKPDVVGYSVYTGTQRYYLDLNQQIKSRMSVFSIFGGPHPTFFPEMIEHPDVDAICVGEGEYATLDLLNALEAGESPGRVANWHIKHDGHVFRNGLRPLLAPHELDALPFADRRLLYEAHRPSARTRIRPIITGRGCPYNCSFCFNRAFADLYPGSKRVRQRSVSRVLQEISQLRDEHGLGFVLFMDDTFIVDRQWLTEFCRRYPEEIGLPWWCQVRADLLDEEKAEMLRSAGCVSVSFGLEAGNDRLRNEILDRHMSREQILDASRLLREKGIAYSTNSMLGLPTGGLMADLETLDLNIECRPDYANVFLYQPYPKTRLGEMAYRLGLMDGSFDDLTGSVSDSTVIHFDTPAEKRQIENLQKLFALTVQYPWLKGAVLRLITLPPNQLFWLVYKLWKGYALNRRLFPMRMKLDEYIKAAWQYMHIRSQ